MVARKFVLLLLVLFMFIFNVLSSSEDSTAPMARAEQETLYSVIRSFVGDWWNGSELFPDPCGWTPIQGVSCDLFDGLWYITGLSIGPVFENSIECAEDANFTSLLFQLKHLRSLSFIQCFSSEKQTTIPPNNWEKLAGSLETLEFRSNPRLTGEIPASFGQLVKLQSLVLVENSLSGQLPASLGSLVSLQKLVISGNQLSDRIPESLANNLTNLFILDLSRNSLTGNIPSSLGSLSSLMKLDLSNNALQGSIPTELGNIRTLTLLDLKSNNLSQASLRPLQSLVSLQDLILSNNPLGGSLWDVEWRRLPELMTLDLSRVSLTGTIPESISSLKKLRFLALKNNNLTGNVPPELSALPSLSALYLNGNNLTGTLEFSGEFYRQMGRRFSSSNNPYLCYIPAGKNIGDTPYGLQKCEQEQKLSNFDLGSRDKLTSSNVVQSSNLFASISLPAYSITGIWCGYFMQELVVVFLLLMLM